MAGIGKTVFSKGFSHAKTGETIVFEVRGTVTHLRVSKEPNNTINLLSLNSQAITHNKLNRDKVNEVIVIVPVQIISLLLEKERDGGYERNSRITGTHTIKSGESLEGIAQKYNLDVNDLAKKNGISDKNKIKIGQVINIKGVKSAQQVKSVNPQVLYPSIIFHVVQKGDSLSSISKKYNVFVADIKSINSLTSNNITLNQRLFLKDADIKKNRERQLAGFILFISLVDASRRTKRPVSVINGKGSKIYISISDQLAAGLGISRSIQVGVAKDKYGNAGVFITVNGQAVTAGTPGIAIDGGATITGVDNIQDLAGLGYSVGAQTHLLLGGSTSVSEKGDVDVTAGWGIGSNSNIGMGYTYLIPLN